MGAVLNTAKVEKGDTVAVFGLGGIGPLSQSLSKYWCKQLYQVDINEEQIRASETTRRD